MNNPLLSLEYNTPHNTFPFPYITPAFIEEAIIEGIRQEEQEIAAITQNSETPTFDNTVVALSATGELLERATTVMYNLLSAETNDELEELAQKMAPILSEHNSNIMLNAELFARVKAVKESVEACVSVYSYNTEELMLITKTYDGFERSGANLPEDKKSRLREIKAELSKLSLMFSQNNIKETNDFQLHITDVSDLQGLPESQIAAAAATAKEKNLGGWLFTLHAPSLHPFLQYSERRELREKIYLAANTRCAHNNEHNNYDICRRIVNLRLELAQLLGYPTFADYVLKNRMAQDTDHVNALLKDLINNYMDTAKEEVAAVQKFAQEQIKKAPIDSCSYTENFVLQPWDFAHYAHLLKLRDYNVDAEMLRPYFPLESVVEGVFGLATRLYGITFHENSDIPVYHNDVKAYDVLDADGSFLAVLYTDFFPREGKQSGAWMTSYREQYILNDVDYRPHVSVTMNFTKPVPATETTEGKPSLLTLGEVETFLHEFGHSLHGMFARTRFASLSGTNVYWDFVELPSQFMENYAMQPEFLRTFARHYKTGEIIPDELVERVRRARNFNVAYACMRQVSFSLLDMSYYAIREPFTEEIKTHEKAVWEAVQLLPQAEDTCMTVQFGHIMSGGYAAGYYSYKWAEQLDADAFEAFTERGMFDKEVAAEFREKILSKGGTIHPAILYRDFRGHDATIDALLRRDGIKKHS